MSSKITGHEQLQRITDALDEDIVNASPVELREALASEGLDEAKVIAEMDAALAEAKKSFGKLRLEQAKAAVATHGSEASNVSSIDRERVRSKLDAMRSGSGENVAGMMMAARKTFAADMLFNGAAQQDRPRPMPAEAWFDFKGGVVSSSERRGSDNPEASWRGCCLKS